MAKFSGCVLVPVRCKNRSRFQVTNFDMRTHEVAVACAVRTLEDKPIPEQGQNEVVPSGCLTCPSAG
jgi:hypothetical protein